MTMPLGPLSIMEKENDSGKPIGSFPGMFCDLCHTSLLHSFSLRQEKTCIFGAYGDMGTLLQITEIALQNKETHVLRFIESI